MPTNALNQLQFSYNVIECIMILLLIRYHFLELGVCGQSFDSSKFWPQIPD